MTITRERLPAERRAVTRVFRLTRNHKDGTVGLVHFYFTVGLYGDGRVGEVFLKADQTGTLASGALDAVAMMMSLLLQYGVPLADIVPKLRGLRFEPSGWTKDPEIPNCSSALDLLAQWLSKRFIPDPQDVKTGA